jgi:hypothetical protein
VSLFTLDASGAGALPPAAPRIEHRKQPYRRERGDARKKSEVIAIACYRYGVNTRMQTRDEDEGRD